MTKADFQKLFQRALNTAARNADKRVAVPISRSFLIELHAPRAPNHLIAVDEAVDYLYLGDKRFFKIVDVAIKELETDSSIVFVRASGHPPVDFAGTCDPGGLGPFKHMLAANIQDHRIHHTYVKVQPIVGEKLGGIERGRAMARIEMTGKASLLVAEKFHIPTDYADRLATAALNGIDSKGGDPEDWDTIVKVIDVVVKSWIENGYLKTA
jgi:hypothetical protein